VSRTLSGWIFLKRGLSDQNLEGVNLLRAMELMDVNEEEGDKEDIMLKTDNIMGTTDGEDM
jgi:hypothetical protein